MGMPITPRLQVPITPRMRMSNFEDDLLRVMKVFLNNFQYELYLRSDINILQVFAISTQKLSVQPQMT